MAGFLYLSTTDLFVTFLFSLMGGGPAYYREFRNIPGLFPLDASGFLQVVTPRNLSRQCQVSTGDRTAPVENLHCTGRLMSPVLLCGKGVYLLLDHMPVWIV
jgi:hypothetical protein